MKMESYLYDDLFNDQKSLYEKKKEHLSLDITKTLIRRPHFHPEIEMIICIDGKAEAVLNGNVHRFERGDICLIFPNQMHYYNVMECGEFMVIIFYPEIVPCIKQLFSNSMLADPIICYNKNKELKNKIYELKDCSIPQEDNLETLLTGYINLIMYYAIPHTKINPISDRNSDILHQILDYCITNFKEEISLKKLSEKFNMSTYRISHIFNENLNLSLPQYINALRIAESCKLLSKTSYSVSKIALEVCFGSFRSFNRAFLEIMRMTPTEYKKYYEVSVVRF